jgi:TatA/E family protein of Tat protein translocase
MFDVGSGELLVILVLALLLFGGKLPDVARNLGRAVAQLKAGFAETTRPLREAQRDVEREVAREAAEEGKRALPGPAGGTKRPEPDV